MEIKSKQTNKQTKVVIVLGVPAHFFKSISNKKSSTLFQIHIKHKIQRTFPNPQNPAHFYKHKIQHTFPNPNPTRKSIHNSVNLFSRLNQTITISKSKSNLYPILISILFPKY